MSVEIRPVGRDAVEDLAALFASTKATAGCWCMWFIVPVKIYHTAGAAGNRENFTALLESNAAPMGLIAYLDGRPSGWCATGPRLRYARAVKTPTYKGRDPAEDDGVWLIPCLYVRDEARRSGVGEALVRAALNLAKKHGATAVEAFPFSGTKRRSTDTQVGFEPMFAHCGFAATRRPSDNRVIMRHALEP